PPPRCPPPPFPVRFRSRPAWGGGTRVHLLDMVSADQLLIAGMHLGEEGFVQIVRTGKSYRVVGKR
ncbi:hypothetical protein BTM36_24520, partial [Herbaspirillum sp. VT-16-41]